MLKLKLQYFGHLMRRTDSLEKTPMLGKIESRRRRGQQRMRWLDGLTDSMTGVDDRVWASSGSWWWTGKPSVLQFVGSQRVRHDWANELDWFSLFKGLPWWFRLLRICLQCRRPSFNPWVGKIPWRREWQPTPVFLPRELHGQRSLAGYSPWGHKE